MEAGTQNPGTSLVKKAKEKLYATAGDPKLGSHSRRRLKHIEKVEELAISGEIHEDNVAEASTTTKGSKLVSRETIRPSSFPDQTTHRGSSFSTHGSSSILDQTTDLASIFNDSTQGSSSSFPPVSVELKDALSSLQQTFVVSDATRFDYPVIYVSSGFSTLTGYTSKEVIGKNCRFLQGRDTDKIEVAKIREAVNAGKSYCGRLLNYKKDGMPFWNLLTITPIKDDTGTIIKFIGMQIEDNRYESQNDNSLHPNELPVSLIRYDARQKEKALSSIAEVVQIVKHPQPSDDGTKGGTAEMDAHEKFSIDVVEKQKTVSAMEISTDARSVTSRMDNDLERLMGPQKSVHSSLLGSTRKSLLGFKGSRSSLLEKHKPAIEPDILMTKDVQRTESWDHVDRESDMRKGLDLATTLERIEKSFVITDPRLPDNPIIFASDSFLVLTEYRREEVLGKNCRFLQGPETNQEAISKIRDAIKEQKELTTELINYTKNGKKFWNLFHLQPMHDGKGELQYFIGVQVADSEILAPHQSPLLKNEEGSKMVKASANDIDEAVRELPDANLRPEDLWAAYSRPVLPKPHKKDSSPWIAMLKIIQNESQVGLEHFHIIKLLGSGDTGSVHLVELKGTSELYAMKEMDKSVMFNRNKVHRACIEREITSLLDHPFLPTLYASFQTATHIYLITDFCPGGELFALLKRQPTKIFREDSARFYAAEVVIGLEYLHCIGIIYRDLKPENVLLQENGHILLTDFDLSFLTVCKPQVFKHAMPRKRRKYKNIPPPTFVAEPSTQSNSFVGTEEYVAPEIITSASHGSATDWWALGILLYEMLYGRTPFKSRNRRRTFTNILKKELIFPNSVPVSLKARHLIHGLLQRDPSNRLGSHGGANEIKQHPFFADINWPLIRCKNPPLLDIPLQLFGDERRLTVSNRRHGNMGDLCQILESS